MSPNTVHPVAMQWKYKKYGQLYHNKLGFFETDTLICVNFLLAIFWVRFSPCLSLIDKISVVSLLFQLLPFKEKMNKS